MSSRARELGTVPVMVGDRAEVVLTAGARPAALIVDANYEHYDFRHAVIRPLHMTRQELQDGADWMYGEFYRLDRLWRTAPQEAFASMPAEGVAPAAG